MGRSKTKKLAEFQFNADAKPRTLDKDFEDFIDLPLSYDVIKDSAEEYSFPEIFDSNTFDVPIPPESLVILANDLDPQTRDEEEGKPHIFEENEKEQEIGHIPLSEVFDISQEIDNTIEKVDSVKFKINHSKIKQQIKPKVQNKVTSAIRMVNLAIDKMSDQIKKKFKMKTDVVDQHNVSSRMLIDDSPQSIEFIRSLGFRLLSLLKYKFPQRFKEFPDKEDLFVSWLNRTYKPQNKLDWLIICSIVAVKLKRTDIELNTYCGIDMGFGSHGCIWTTHQYLMFLNLYTIDLKSDSFYNFVKVAFNFHKIYGGKRLYYLEHIAWLALEEDRFFKSHHFTFAEHYYEKWKNERFKGLSNCITDQILRKLMDEDATSLND